MVALDFYTNGDYLKKNPDWHVDSSPWKAQGVLEIMERNHVHPKTICEIGCGAGEILRLMQQKMDDDCTFLGYDIAPQAITLAKRRENEHLHVKLADFRKEGDTYFDLLLLVDVLEHFEDMFAVLREIKPKSEYKILQLPLDISMASVLKNELIEYRHATGHLHFFTKDLALEILQDAGYEILDYFYTIPPLYRPSFKDVISKPYMLPYYLLKMAKRTALRVPRAIGYAINKDLAVRVFGGWRLVVLIK